jgi:ADP-heptose:LPS heptosyltransferase
VNTESRLARAVLAAAGAIVGPGRVPSLPRSFRRILVVRQHDQLGDMMCVIPLLRTLRDAWPEAALSLVTSPVNHGVMAGHPYLREVLLYDKREIARSPAALVRFCRRLRALDADLAIVPSTVSVSLTSGIIARLSGAPVRLGPGRLEHRDNPSKFLYTHAVDLDWSGTPGRHQALRNADILGPLGLTASLTPYVLGLSAADEAAAAAILTEGGAGGRRLFGIHPGAAKPGNRWPAERFAELAGALHREYGNLLVVTTGPRDTEVREALTRMLDVPFLVVRDRPIGVVAAVIDRLELFVSNDTGPLHIAGALHPPVVGLFGPTDPAQWAPPGEKNRSIAGPGGAIGSITVAEVMNTCREALAGRG